MQDSEGATPTNAVLPNAGTSYVADNEKRQE